MKNGSNMRHDDTKIMHRKKTWQIHQNTWQFFCLHQQDFRFGLPYSCSNELMIHVQTDVHQTVFCQFYLSIYYDTSKQKRNVKQTSEKHTFSKILSKPGHCRCLSGKLITSDLNLTFQTETCISVNQKLLKWNVFSAIHNTFICWFELTSCILLIFMYRFLVWTRPFFSVRIDVAFFWVFLRSHANKWNMKIVVRNWWENHEKTPSKNYQSAVKRIISTSQYEALRESMHHQWC